MKESKLSLFYVSLLYRVSSIILMYSMVTADDLYVGFSFKDSYLMMISVISILLLLVYNHVTTHQDIVKVAVYIETAFLLLIYFITGGLYSPIIWLIVNPPLFYMFYYRKIQFIQGLIIIFIFTTLLGPYMVGKTLNELSFKYLPGLFLVIMIFVIISMLSKQHEQNRDKSNLLSQMKIALEKGKNENEVLKDWLFNSYSLMDQLLSIREEKEGVDVIFSYMNQGIEIDGFFIGKSAPDGRRYYSSNEIEKIVTKEDGDYTIKEYPIEGDDYYGDFCVVCKNSQQYQLIEFKTQIELLVKVITFFFDRNQFRESYVQLLIKEEQRRIAEEIHDGVKQDIHGISYFIYNIIKSSDTYDKEEIVDKLNRIYETINETTYELKKTIYKLGDHDYNLHWADKLEQVISRLESQYNLKINTDYYQNVKKMDLSVGLTEAIKRCLKEGVSNAVEHGQANQIDIEYRINGQYLELLLLNNGRPIEDKKTSVGLGLSNLKKLTMIHNGDFLLKNEAEKGVRLELSFMYAG